VLKFDVFRNIVILVLIVLVVGIIGFILIKEEPTQTHIENEITPIAVSPTPEYMEFAGRRILIKRVNEGQYCEGRLGSQQVEYPKCKENLRCVQEAGTAADAPGICMK